MILFAAPPFAGHLDRLIPLACAAQAAGYRCHVVTGPRRLDDLEGFGLSAEAPPSLPRDALERLAEGYGQIHGRPWRALAQLRENLRLLPALTEDLVAIAGRVQAEVVVADSIAVMAGPAARRLRLPWITTIATPLALEAPDGTPSYLGGLTPRADRWGALRDTLGRRVQRGVKRVAFGMFGAPVRHLLPRLYRPDGSEAIYSPDAILGFGMTELEFPRTWPAPFEMIGPLHGPRRAVQPLPLPQGGARVLATLGTHLPWARADWEAGVIALARARPDVHFTLTRGQKPGPPLPALPNLLVVPFADYATEVPRHDVILHHGGSGITYAAIEAGKPSLVVPQDFDQFDYAARVSHFGLGIWRADLRGAEDDLDHLLRGAWPAVRRFAQAAKAYDPQGRFLDVLGRFRP